MPSGESSVWAWEFLYNLIKIALRFLCQMECGRGILAKKTNQQGETQ